MGGRALNLNVNETIKKMLCLDQYVGQEVKQLLLPDVPHAECEPRDQGLRPGNPACC